MSLSAAEAARLNTWLVAIAGETRGTPIADSAGNYRFGSNRSGLCVYAKGQFHDFSGGEREHGFNALQLIQHLYPNDDAVVWARDWLAQHPGDGAFTAQGENEPTDDFAEVEAMAFVERLYAGAQPINETPAHNYLTGTRGLPLAAEDQAQLRWVANYRGDEGALLAPVTDDAGKLVKLLVTHVTVGGRKSPHGPGRTTIRGARRPGLCRLGSPGPNVVETEGLEKGLAARTAGAEYVVITGGISNLGKVPLQSVVQSVIIARDADPVGSPADQALWRGVVRRLGQGLKVAVTARPNDMAPKDAPPLKDLDDVHRYDPELVPVLLKGANLEHGRLGEATDNVIYEDASRLTPGVLSHARKGLTTLLRISLGALDDELGMRVRARVEKREEVRGPPELEPWADPVTDIGAVLDEAVRIMKKYVAAPDTHFDTTALWCAHAHLIHREELGIDVTPRLAFQSPEEDSGKTTFMKLARAQVPRPKGVGSLTGSSLFRAVDARKITLLVDEGDFVFRADANPELLQIFNSGNERTFAFVSRSIPLGDGQFEDHDFNTFAAMCFTSIDKLATKSMQSRCVALRMKPATREEAAALVRFRASHCPELKACGRKLARWAMDLPELPEIEIPSNFVNRIADNWRSLLQIARLAGGTWPDRALAAAEADAGGDVEETRERGAGRLLGAIWRVFAAETTNPRRMHTSDLLIQLLEIDEGRWQTANRGKPIDAYYLRSKLGGYVTPDAKGPEGEKRPRQWKPPGSTKMKWGYHELHLGDAFLRYLGKGLPSEPVPEPGADESPKTPFSSKYPVLSAPSALKDVSPDISTAYTGADAGVDADGLSASEDAPGDGTSRVRMAHPHPQSISAPTQVTDKSNKNVDGADGADHPRVYREIGNEDRGAVTPFPRGPAGRKVRKGGEP